jgi:uncharacterized protein YidB (DUF937 family)
MLKIWINLFRITKERLLKMEEKMDEKRNEKGQFVKGYSGGPGRGYKKEEQVKLDGELLDMIEQVVITGLGAKDLKDRLKAAGIGIRVQSMRGPDDSAPVLEPFVSELMVILSNLAVSYSSKTGVPTSPLEMIKQMARVCPNCDRFGGEAFELEEVRGGDL